MKAYVALAYDPFDGFAMRTPLTELQNASYDVIVVGGGISGTSAAQHLAAAGYSVLLVEKDDFASAATSRSGRVLHCGLRYLAPAYSPWEFLRHPGKLFTAIRVARKSSLASDEFVATTPERARRMTLSIPVYRDSPFPGWQVGLGAALLKLVAGRRLPLAFRRASAAKAQAMPLAKWLRAPDKLESVVSFDDYQFDWPERICLDCALDAERMGAIVRNYTSAVAIERVDGLWKVDLRDELAGNGASVTVSAPLLLNMAGAWIDKVNVGIRGAGKPPRKVVGVKGVHVLVRLPPECAGQGLAGINRENEGIACLPWGGLHFVGPTETVYEGDIDDVRPLEEDITFLLDEINYLLPGIRLERKDVLQSWAGIRPITYDPALPKGRRMPFSVLQDLEPEGLPNVLTITWAAIMFHRDAAREVVATVAKKLKPSGRRKKPDYSARSFPENQNSPPLVFSRPEVKVADIAYAARHEKGQTLVDLLFRRTGLGWRASIPKEAVRTAAEIAGQELGWDERTKEHEIEKFHAYVASYHGEPATEWNA
jgi:glycerol-3-phosphate dehydrogenase